MNNKILVLASILIGLIFVEIALRIITPFPIHGVANRVPDKILGHRLRDGMEDIDKAGFRNASVIPHADLVTIGDSHTYGVNVSREQSWPYQLANYAGLSVYNLGMGGYGILQHAYLIDTAIEKKPKYIILGLYLANDLSDYCKFATLPYWKEPLLKAGLRVDVCKTEPGKPGKKQFNLKRSIKSLATSTAVGSTIDYIISTRSARGDGILINNGNNEIWISDYRIGLISGQLDISSEKIQEGYRANQHFLDEIINKTKSNNIKFGVMIIPSRERVLSGLALSEASSINKILSLAISRENKLAEEFGNFFKERDVPYVDALPDLRDALAISKQENISLYPLIDGHPLELGYKTYADAANKLLQQFNQ